MSDQIQIKTGETVVNTITTVNGASGYNTTNNETSVYSYSNATVLGFNLNQILGLMFILISVWSGFRYMIGVKAKS
jgi:hypothetical protein